MTAFYGTIELYIFLAAALTIQIHLNKSYCHTVIGVGLSLVYRCLRDDSRRRGRRGYCHAVIREEDADRSPFLSCAFEHGQLRRGFLIKNPERSKTSATEPPAQRLCGAWQFTLTEIEPL